MDGSRLERWAGYCQLRCDGITRWRNLHNDRCCDLYCHRAHQRSVLLVRSSGDQRCWHEYDLAAIYRGHTDHNHLSATQCGRHWRKRPGCCDMEGTCLYGWFSGNWVHRVGVSGCPDLLEYWRPNLHGYWADQWDYLHP